MRARHRRYYRDKVVAGQSVWDSRQGSHWIEWARSAWDNILLAVETSRSAFARYATAGDRSSAAAIAAISANGANAATVAGHVVIEDHVTVGALSPVHQFCRIGRYAYIGACTVITQDVPPFARVVTERETKSFGINSIGLERKGFSEERRKALQRAFRLLLRSKLNTSQALAKMREQFHDSADVIELVQFIETAERGIVK